MKIQIMEYWQNVSKKEEKQKEEEINKAQRVTNVTRRLTKLYLYKNDWSPRPDEEHDLKYGIENIQIKPTTVTIVMKTDNGHHVETYDLRRFR